MFTAEAFGKRLKQFRKRMNLTQKETAAKIGVSEQAMSKWENGNCLPDVYHLKLLAQALHVTADCLVDTEQEGAERVVETIKFGGAVFEIVEKPETILAGKIIYAKDYADMEAFDKAIGAFAEDGEQLLYESLAEPVLPISDMHLSINFWREEEARGYGFVRAVHTERQPEGVDVYKLPAALYIRAYTDAATAQLMLKEQCETWELFAYIRQYLMPQYGCRMAENGAQELEVFDIAEHRTGYVYMPVMRE